MLRRTLLLGAAMLLAGCAANPTQAPAGSGALAADYVKGSIKSVVMLPVLHASKAHGERTASSAGHSPRIH